MNSTTLPKPVQPKVPIKTGKTTEQAGNVPKMPVKAKPALSAKPTIPKPGAPPALSKSPAASIPVASVAPASPASPAAPAVSKPSVSLKPPTGTPLQASLPPRPGTPPVPVGLNSTKKGMPTSGVPIGLSRQSPGGAAPPPPPPPPKPMSKSGSGNSSSQPVFAKSKKPPQKLMFLGLGGVVVLIVVGFLLSSIFGGSKSSSVGSGSSSGGVSTGNTNGSSGTSGGSTGGNQSDSSSGEDKISDSDKVILTYWGLWEPSEVLDEVISDFENSNPGIKIDYRMQSHKDYRERLQTAIASGNGPDLFRFHAAWVPMLREELAALPSKVMSADEYQKTFYSSAAKRLQVNGQLIGVPLMYDGLGLYYNKEILKTAGVQPPESWGELRKLASDLSVPSKADKRTSSNLERSGLAIGNAENVDHFSDILALLILQNGGDPLEPAYEEVRDAMIFYTNFVKEDKIWSESLPSSTVAFARGEAAMMFAPSWRAHDIKNMNPDLDFAIAPVPQLSDDKIALASYWAEGVNSKSNNKTEAWVFIKYISSASVMKKLYSAASQTRAFGEIYSRQDLAGELSSNELISGYLSDALIAEVTFISSATHGNGINDQIIQYYKDAINAVLSGKPVDDVLKTVDQGVKQVTRQYGSE